MKNILIDEFSPLIVPDFRDIIYFPHLGLLPDFPHFVANIGMLTVRDLFFHCA